MESIIQTGEKEIVFSFLRDTSYWRQVSEGNLPMCRILTTGSCDWGSQEGSPLVGNHMIACLSVRSWVVLNPQSCTNSSWYPKLYLSWMSSFGSFNISTKPQLKYYLSLNDLNQSDTVSFSRASSTCFIVPSSGRTKNEVTFPLYGISTTQQDNFSSLWTLKWYFWCIILTLTEFLASKKKSPSLVPNSSKGLSQAPLKKENEYRNENKVTNKGMSHLIEA